MKLLSLVALILFLFSKNEIETQNIQTNIVNGYNAVEGQFPYMVSVRYKGVHNCGGTIIGKKWVLTAAHCLYASYDSLLSVLYGTIYLQNGKFPENNTVNASRSIIHENYQAYGGYENDIALIELQEELKFDFNINFISPQPLQKNQEKIIKGLVIGWGYNTTEGSVSDVLQYAIVDVFTNDLCVASYNNSVINPGVHVCAGSLHGGTGQCTGDSGGPLVVNGFQIGIVSWSEKPCASPGNPGVFTRVSTYVDWIFNNTGIKVAL